MTSRLDYLTLTIRSDSKDFFETLTMLCKDMFLENLVNKMKNKGGIKYYPYHLSYENIEFFYTDPEFFEEQGMCIKISSEGLDYFLNYLGKLKVDFRDWCRKWRGLVFEGYETKCTRIDYAIDDIVKEGEKATLTMDKVLKTYVKGEFCTRLGKSGDFAPEKIARLKYRVKRIKGETVEGNTLYLGNRSGERLIRFYDKKAERLHNGKPMSDKITSWTRFEAEYHRDKAMNVFNAFCDYDDDNFCEYMSQIINGQFRFINLDNNNVSRCSLKSWWVKFLNGCEKHFQQYRKRPARSALARSLRGLSQYSTVINSLVQGIGWKGFGELIKNEVAVKQTLNKPTINEEILENLKEDKQEYETMNRLKNYVYNADDDFIGYLYEMHQKSLGYNRYLSNRFGCGKALLNSFEFTNFINGQEVLAV